MKCKGKKILITGANRGIGRALLEEALRRDVNTAYAGARHAFSHSDERVRFIPLDITDLSQIGAAVATIHELDILINNAGVDYHDDLSDRSGLDRHLGVNLFGTYEVTKAFIPTLAGSKGSIVNMLSMASLASVPFSPAYATSKAAAFSLTQSLRALWAEHGLKVHAVFAGPVDTDMARGLDIPKASPESVAKAIFDGLERGDDDIFPDPMSREISTAWRNGISKKLERQFSEYTPEKMARSA